jgi:hypothetical protein
VSRRGLQAVLVILGLVALGAGLVTVLTGSASVLDAPEAAPSLDSELRFYAAWVPCCCWRPPAG